MSDRKKTVKVLELVVDWSLWPRYEAGKLDGSNLKKLKEILQDGKPFNTPIIVDAQSMRITDGFHRQKALVDVLGVEATTEVILRDYSNETAMRIDAIKMANTGSLQLTSKDRVHSAICLRKNHVPWPVIAEALDMTVERLRNLVEGRSIIAQDGVRIAVSAGVETLSKNLDGKPADSDQEHFARTQNGNPPLMHARMLLNAMKAHGAVDYDDQFSTVMDEICNLWNDMRK